MNIGDRVILNRKGGLPWKYVGKTYVIKSVVKGYYSYPDGYELENETGIFYEKEMDKQKEELK